MNRKALLIGWDAADWKMIHPLLDAGKMPNLERFLSEGVMGNLATLQPILSPMLWTSIATGKRAYKHGIYGFSEPDPVAGGIRPVTNLSRKTKAIWNILNQNQMDTITVGWWPSHPVEELSRGTMISNHYQRASGPEDNWPLLKGCVHPKRLTEVMKELRFHPNEIDQETFMTFLPALAGMNQEQLDEVAKDPRIKSLAKIIADCTSVQSATTALMQNEPWDLCAVYFDAIDHFGHGFMKYHPPRQGFISEADFNIYKDAVESGYRYHDMLLGTLLALAGDDTLVMICSDHGFHPDHLRPQHIPIEPAGPAAEHRPLGIFAARGPGLKRDEVIHGASLLDICPTLLHYFGLPVGEDMDGKVLLDIFEQPTEIERIETWDKVEGDSGTHPDEQQISPEEAKEAMDQLIALGYIDDPGENRQQAMDETVRELDYNRAQSLLDGGLPGKAAEILERLYDKWRDEHRFGIKLSSCYRNLKRTDELRAIVSLIRERRLQSAQTAVEEIKQQGLDDEDKAKAEQQRIAELPEKEQEREGRARRNLFARANPNFTSLRFLEAQADLADGRLDEALAQLQAIEGETPPVAGQRRLPINAVLLRAEIRLRRREWEAAKADLELVHAHDDEHPNVHLGLARAHMGLKDYEQAAQWALSSLGLHFHQPWAHYLHALALQRAGRWQEAEQAYLLAARFQRMAPAAYRKLYRIARHRRQDAVAMAHYKAEFKRARAELREQLQRQLANRDLVERQIAARLPDFPGELAELPQPEDASQIITLVSGLPRSGTSLMMQMLEAAGVAPLTDGERAADESNPRGYYEHQRVSGIPREQDFEWLLDARGRSLKVVAPLLPFLPYQVKGERLHYRVLFMQRDSDEIIESQRLMLQRQGKDAATADIARAYRQQMLAAITWMRRGAVPAIAADYAELIGRPAQAAVPLAGFIGAVDAPQAMAAAVDPGLYRTRMEDRDQGQTA